MVEGLISKLKRELEIINSSKKTVKAYTYYVERFLRYAEKKGFNENVVKDYIQIIIKKQNPSTVSSCISAVEFFFENVLNQKIKLKHPKRNKTIPEILTIDEIRKLIEATSNIKHKLILKLMYGCGLRVSEVVNLKKPDLNFQEELIYIKLSKGRKDRFVKIPESIKKELESYYNLTNEKILFPSSREGKLTTSTIQKIVSNSSKKAGIKEFILIY